MPEDPDIIPEPEEALEQTFRGIRKLRPGQLTRRENRAVWGLCGIYSLGILGLYTVLPVLSPYAHGLTGQTSVLVGLAIGAYGLTQTIFQIPFGHLSDRVGRKRAIFYGLLLFSVGGIVAASSDNIAFLILGRLLQGVGAVASAVVSLVADLTRPSVRTQAMARMGIAIGGAFAFGMIVGPLLAHFVGVRFIFWMTSALSLVAAFYLLIFMPAPKHKRESEQVHAGDLLTILRQPPMLFLDLGTFLLHTVVTILFVIVPFDLHQGQAPGATFAIWKVAVPAMLVGIGTMFLTARHSDREGRARLVLYAGAGLLLASCLVFAFAGQQADDTPRLMGVLLGTVVFVLSVALLEPALPSRMTHFAVGKHRGAAMGVFHMSQFLGTFAGGLLGGAFLKSDRAPLFIGLAVASGLWMMTISRINERRELPAPASTDSNPAGEP
jgi:MFS family permease